MSEVILNIDGKTQLKAIDPAGTPGYITLDRIEEELGLVELRAALETVKASQKAAEKKVAELQERLAALEPEPPEDGAPPAKKKKGGSKK